MLPSPALFGRLWRKLKTLWQLAKSERASPREIAWAIALGVFVGCTPAVGFHGAVALAAATLAKKNRLFTWIGSRMSNAFFLPFIIIAELQIAHRLRTGAWLALDWHKVREQAPALFLDWIIGTIPVGVFFATIFGLLAWRLALRRDRRRALALQDSNQTGSIES